MGQSHPKLVKWAAHDGRVNDLVFHLSYAGQEALKANGDPKRQTPMHLAAIGGHVECIRVLWEVGASLNAVDKEGHTPLHLAAANRHYKCVLVLLQLGADLSITTRFDVSPLHISASVGHTPCIEVLVQWGAYIDFQESWGQSALIIATIQSHIHCMKTLIQLRADTEVKDYLNGQTALHVACASKDEEVVLVLLDAGADLTATDGKGLSPLGVALVNKYYNIVPLLLEYGARLNYIDRQYLPNILQEYVDKQAGTVNSLLRLSRVALRKTLGPSDIDTVLPNLGMPSHLVPYVQQVREVCDGTAVKQASVCGSAAEQKKIHQFEIECKV